MYRRGQIFCLIWTEHDKIRKKESRSRLYALKHFVGTQMEHYQYKVQ